MSFGEELRRLRTQVGVSVPDLAARTGIFRDYLLAIEANQDKATAYTVEKVIGCLRQLGIQEDDLAGLSTLAGDTQALRKSKGESEYLALAKQRQKQMELNRLRHELVREGIGLVWLGLAHFTVKWLEHDWGYVLGAVGLACILVRRRFMWAFIALVLVLAGISNIFALSPPWGFVVGSLQLYWASRARNKWLD